MEKKKNHSGGRESTCKDADPAESSAYVLPCVRTSVLVPFLFGISPAIVLLMNGVGTLVFIVVTKGKSTGVPGFQFCISGSGGAGH